MADTQRTRAQILALFVDNVTGQISAQDLRDFVVTVMESEFANPGDFWSRPQAKYNITNETAKGWIEYSQYIGEACSWMNAMYMDQSTGRWYLANVANSLKTGLIGLAMNSYAAGVSTANILKEGIVYDASFSATFSGNFGRPIYLASGFPGSITLVITTSVLVLGGIAQSDNFSGISAIGKWYFKPEWAVRGA
jgi:hypothetical protein